MFRNCLLIICQFPTCDNHVFPSLVLQTSQVTISSGPVISAPPKPTFPAYSSGPKPSGGELSNIQQLSSASTAVQKVVKPAQGANGMKMKLMHPDEDISLVSEASLVLIRVFTQLNLFLSFSFFPMRLVTFFFSCVKESKGNRKMPATCVFINLKRCVRHFLTFYWIFTTYEVTFVSLSLCTIYLMKVSHRSCR